MPRLPNILKSKGPPGFQSSTVPKGEEIVEDTKDDRDANHPVNISNIKQEADDACDVNENIELKPSHTNKRMVTLDDPIAQLFLHSVEYSDYDDSDVRHCAKNSKVLDPINIKNVINQPTGTKSLPGKKYICILCAASNNTNDIPSRPIICFAKLILDFAGVNILTINSSPMACYSCFKQLQQVDNLKKQIMYTNKLIYSSSSVLGEFLAMEDFTSGALDPSGASSSGEVENLAPENKRKIAKVADPDDDYWFRWDDEPSPHLNRPKVQIVDVEGILRKNLPAETKLQKKGKKDKYVCAVCGKQYGQLNKLRSHKYVHEDGQYLCEICGSVFFYDVYLMRHMRTHSGQKPFKCNFCDRTFSLKWNMIQHKRLHTNVLPYKCKLCPKAFRHNVTLKKHVVKSHSAVECANATQNGAEENSTENSASKMDTETT